MHVLHLAYLETEVLACVGVGKGVRLLLFPVQDHVQVTLVLSALDQVQDCNTHTRFGITSGKTIIDFIMNLSVTRRHLGPYRFTQLIPLSIIIQPSITILDMLERVSSM